MLTLAYELTDFHVQIVIQRLKEIYFYSQLQRPLLLKELMLMTAALCLLMLTFVKKINISLQTN